MNIWEIIWERIRDSYTDEEWQSIISEDERKRRELEYEDRRPQVYIEPPPPPEPPEPHRDEEDDEHGGVIIIEM